MLPVLFEPEFDDIERKLMWVREETRSEDVDRQREIADETPQFVIDDEEDEEDTGGPSVPKSPASPASRKKQTDSSSSTQERKKHPSLAEKLIHCTIELLFCCGFTLPNAIQVENEKINYVIWYVLYTHTSLRTHI